MHREHISHDDAVGVGEATRLRPAILQDLKLLDCQAWTKYEAGAGIIDP
jgi:hypothetical protein